MQKNEAKLQDTLEQMQKQFNDLRFSIELPADSVDKNKMNQNKENQFNSDDDQKPGLDIPCQDPQKLSIKNA